MCTHVFKDESHRAYKQPLVGGWVCVRELVCTDNCARMLAWLLGRLLDMHLRSGSWLSWVFVGGGGVAHCH